MSREEPLPFTTAQPDIRFPNANVTRYCFQMFFDYHKCLRLMGAGYEPCEVFKKNYTSLCPYAWVEKWELQLEDKCFPRDLPEVRK